MSTIPYWYGIVYQDYHAGLPGTKISFFLSKMALRKNESCGFVRLFVFSDATKRTFFVLKYSLETAYFTSERSTYEHIVVK